MIEGNFLYLLALSGEEVGDEAAAVAAATTDERHLYADGQGCSLPLSRLERLDRVVERLYLTSQELGSHGLNLLVCFEIGFLLRTVECRVRCVVVQLGARNFTEAGMVARFRVFM